MNKMLLGIFLCGAAATASAQVGVSVSIGEPGFYGQINIGGYPAPQVIYQQPVIVERGPEYRDAPVYLRVPPGYEKHWRRHCAAYHACGRRVYFVRNDWYTRDYAPRYREAHRGDHGKHDRDRHDEHGHGHGHGGDHDNHGDHGHGHDHD